MGKFVARGNVDAFKKVPYMLDVILEVAVVHYIEVLHYTFAIGHRCEPLQGGKSRCPRVDQYYF